jgi:hypothetical protein
MSAQPGLSKQAMTEEDRQFDALLRRAAQHPQEVKVNRRNSEISVEKAGIVAGQTFGLQCP